MRARARASGRVATRDGVFDTSLPPAPYLLIVAGRTEPGEHDPRLLVSWRANRLAPRASTRAVWVSGMDREAHRS